MKKYDNFFQKDNTKKVIIEDKEKAKIYSQKELDVFLLKLKNYFNEINGITLSNRKKIEYLNMEEARIEKVLFQNPKEIEFQGKMFSEVENQKEKFEKISKKFINFKDRNEEQLKKKNEFYQLNLVELEYKKTLEFKIENEKENLNKLFSNIEDVQEKIKSLVLAEKRISTSSDPDFKQSMKLNKFKKELEEENQIIKKLLVSQEGKLNKLTEIIDLDTNLLNEKREKVKGKNILMSIEMKDKKEGIIKCYEETENLRKLKVNKENHYTNITLGLNLIKNYLMRSTNTNKEQENILSSFNDCSDYNVFKGIKETPSRERSSTARSKKGQKDLQEEYFYFKGAKISLSYLKEKINNTDMEYDDLYEFYTRILNKKNFNQNIITKFNNQQIKLESQKEINNKKIQNMILKNYKNVDLIIKSNTQLENLLKKYHNYSSKILLIPSKFYNFPELINDNKEFSSKCIYFLKEIKLFLEYIVNIGEILEKEKAFDEDNNKKLKVLIQRISNYFIFAEKVNNNEEQYINELFNFFENHTKINLDANNNTVLIPNLCSSKINDITKLKEFYKYQKDHFFSINHEMEIKKYYTIHSLDERLLDIIDIILSLVNNLFNIESKPSNHNTLNSEDDYLLTNYTTTNTLKRSYLNSRYQIRNHENGSKLDENSSYTEANNERLFVRKISRNNKFSNKNIRDFINRHYNPYLESKKFHITLNENSTAYRHLSLKVHKDLKSIDKKQEETNKIKDQMFMYNNPKINVESLSKTTYNSFVRQIITNQVEKTKPNTQFTFNKLKKKFKNKK